MSVQVAINTTLASRVERAARARGMSTTEFVECALEHEIEERAAEDEAQSGEVQSQAAEGKPSAVRLDFPLVKSKTPGSVLLTNDIIRQLDEEEDLRQARLAGILVDES